MRIESSTNPLNKAPKQKSLISMSLVPGVAGIGGRGVGCDSGASVDEAHLQAKRLPLYPTGRLHHRVLQRLPILHHHQTPQSSLLTRNCCQGMRVQ